VSPLQRGSGRREEDHWVCGERTMTPVLHHVAVGRSGGEEEETSLRGRKGGGKETRGRRRGGKEGGVSQEGGNYCVSSMNFERKRGRKYFLLLG